MNCPNCQDTRLDVTHTFSAGDNAETRNLKCRVCGYRASSMTFLVRRPQERKKGKGGRALSLLIRSGTIINPVDGKKPNHN